jgi:pimeloyl-ACP methyl ester carboxylesterase
MSAVILQDEIVHYEVLGRGRPLFFLHGWIGSWRYWIPAMQAASISYRAYAIDLWGFGDTAKDPTKYGIPQQVNLVNDFSEKLGIGKIALIGHGLGAIVALNYAVQYSAVVDRIMVISMPMSDIRLNPRLYTTSPSDLADWLLGHMPTAETARAEAPKTDAQAISISLANLDHFNWVELSRQISTPCLFVHGSNDPAVALPDSDDLNALPEQAHQISFEQSGHFPMLDESSKFNRLMADFLALPSGESPRQLQLKEEWKRRVR